MQNTLQTGYPVDIQQVSALFNRRDPHGNKGSFGCAAILGGARGMTGSVILAGRAALKTGAGKVMVGIAQTPMPVAYDSNTPELMLHEAEDLLETAHNMEAWAAGCGLGQSEYALNLLRQLFIKRKEIPFVLDADGLNAIASGEISSTWGKGEIVLTPHPTEAARLLQTETKKIQEDRSAAAMALAKKYKAWVVLKGAGTIICAPDLSWQMNVTGNVGLATAGSGDVLSGMLVSLLAQGLPMSQAVPAGVWLHGAAADRLVKQGVGPIGLTAGELADAARSIRNYPENYPEK
jgi:hydroxyethylthiazole kinase-like uncharacterized protein yjeF